MGAVNHDFEDYWRTLQLYHRGDPEQRALRLRGYLKVKLRMMRPPRARDRLARFIEEAQPTAGPEPREDPGGGSGAGAR